MALNLVSNFAANVAHRNLAATDMQATSSLAKLSSGTRVVSAKDDAASLAIGSRINAEVASLKQASVNAGQASSMLQIADGAMAKVSDILTRMKTLSVQAGSDQVSSTERNMLDTEYQALLSEVDRIAADTEFNGSSLVNGSTHASSAVTVAVGATLGGTGTIGGNTIIRGIHSPGNSPGIQTFAGNLTYEDGGDPDPLVQWELIGNTVTNLPNPNALFDTIVVGGILNFDDPTALSLIFNSPGSTVDWANSFWNTSHLGTNGWLLYDVTAATSNFGNLSITTSNWLDSNSLGFNSARPGSSFSLVQDGDDIYLNYNFVAAAIPEPGTLALALAALIGLCGLTRTGKIRLVLRSRGGKP